LTGLANRRAWERLVAVYSERFMRRRDQHIRRAEGVLRAATRDDDVVARLYAELHEAGVTGSVGWAPISVLHGFLSALADADAARYIAKRDRRTGRPAPLMLVPGRRPEP